MEEAAMLMESAETLSALYKELNVPVRLIAGSDDRIVETDKHSARLHRELGSSTFQNVPGSGHMVHHAAPEEVIAAIAEVSEIRQSRAETKSRAMRRKQVQRQWLYIGDTQEESDRLALAG